MRYRFRLETVLRVRRVGEQSARQSLAVAVRQRLEAQQALSSASQWRNSLSSPLGPTSVEAFLSERAQVDRAVHAVGAARVRCEHAEIEMSERTAVWSEARARVRALERLDERRREEHLIEELRLEAKGMDELASMRWLRSNSSGSDGFADGATASARVDGSHGTGVRIGDRS